jgi:hypothetical protein
VAATERLTPQIFRPDVNVNVNVDANVDLDATATLPMAPARSHFPRGSRPSKSRRPGEEFDSEQFYATNVLPHDVSPRSAAETTGLQQLRKRTRRLRGLVLLILAPLTLLAAFNMGRATASPGPPASLAKQAIPTIITQASLPPASAVPVASAPPAISRSAVSLPVAAPPAPKPVRPRRRVVHVPATREPAPAAENASLPTTRENPSDGVLNGD